MDNEEEQQGEENNDAPPADNIPAPPPPPANLPPPPPLPDWSGYKHIQQGKENLNKPPRQSLMESLQNFQRSDLNHSNNNNENNENNNGDNNNEMNGGPPPPVPVFTSAPAPFTTTAELSALLRKKGVKAANERSEQMQNITDKINGRRYADFNEAKKFLQVI